MFQARFNLSKQSKLRKFTDKKSELSRFKTRTAQSVQQNLNVVLKTYSRSVFHKKKYLLLHLQLTLIHTNLSFSKIISAARQEKYFFKYERIFFNRFDRLPQVRGLDPWLDYEVLITRLEISVRLPN